MKRTKQLFVAALALGALALTACGEKEPQPKTFVHADGTRIVDINGENLITRSIGIGNWLLQEGYMMQSAAFAGPMYQYRALLEEHIGKERTQEFYTSWYDNHFRKADLDSMKKWGYNSVRPALHYKMFTLPIEDEPVEGENTWLEDGFRRLDEFVAWCTENQMYAFLDMHGCPGGQGKDANISDYDTTKPSLWEDTRNEDKLVALWRKIAERYADEQWIGGYDLINETNWPELGDNNNKQLRDLFGRMTAAVREVDTNHMIIVEGNWWANDFTGLTDPWDDNLCYSFHKYWNENVQGSIKFVTDLRDSLNVPLWLGESGENSNEWFSRCIALMEENNIGWSFWPVKKSANSNVMRVITNDDYKKLMRFWETGEPKMTSDEIYNAVMTFSNNHRSENCIVQRDVIDAMIHQPSSKESRPYFNRTQADVVYAVDYDFGGYDVAYSDVAYLNHKLPNVRTVWNEGNLYRNDGVDIMECSDELTNGYAVSWIDDQEWLQHTVNVTEEGEYTLELRYRGANGGELHFENLTERIILPCSQDWATFSVPQSINLKRGENKLRVVFDKGGFDLSYYKLVKM